MTKIRRKRKKEVLLWLILADLILIMGMMISMSYFTGSDETTNRFRAQRMDIALSEPRFTLLDPSVRSTLIPNRLLPKDPMIQNIEPTDVFVFIKLTVPVYESANVSDNGTVLGSKKQEVFLLKSGSSPETAVEGFHTKENDADREYWVELTSFEEGTDHQTTSRTYIFAYSVYLKQHESTEPLFDYLELKNIRQFEIDPDDILDVKVDAYGIQADHIENILKDIGNEKAVMSAEKLAVLYGMIDE